MANESLPADLENERARMEAFYRALHGTQVGWGRDKTGAYHAQFARDAWAAWQEARLPIYAQEIKRLRAEVERLSRPAHEREPPHCATCECDTDELNARYDPMSRDELIAECEKLRTSNSNLLHALNAKQAKIDALMLEFCPGEMPKEQREEWARHQAPVELSLDVNCVHPVSQTVTTEVRDVWKCRTCGATLDDRTISPRRAKP